MSTAIAVRPDAKDIQELLRVIKECCGDVRSRVSVEYEDDGGVWYTAWAVPTSSWRDGISETWICVGGSGSVAGLSRVVRQKPMGVAT